MVYDLQNPSPVLLENCSDYLFGLLLGFGEKNSYLFRMRSNGQIPFESGLSFDEQDDQECNINYLRQKDVTIEDLPIPRFVTFSFADEQFFTYKREREKFIDLYRDRDFLEATLEYLKNGAFY